MDIDVLASAYLRSRVTRREIGKLSAIRTRTVLTSFVQSFGRRPVHTVGERDIERWLATRKHVAISTLRYDIVTLRGFMVWLRRQGHVRRDPMTNIATPRVPRSVPRALMRSEVASLLAVLPDARAEAIVMLMLGLGLRRAEVASLQAGDWDRVACTLRVCGKGGHERLLPVPVRVSSALDRYRIRVSAGPLIRREDGRGGLSPKTISGLMHAWMTEAGIKRGPYDGRACHSLRHTLASDIADVESDLRVLQQILGHTQLSSTQVYLRRAESAKLRTALEGAA